MKNLTLVIAAACVGSAFTFGVAHADCQSDATVARGELQKAGQALEAATKKKAQPDVLCPLFRKYAAAEAGWTKFLSDNKDWCQVPEKAIEQAQTSAKRARELRDQICKVAETGIAPGGPQKPPPQGSMSSALGITTGYQLGQSEGHGGNVFDTLNGNILKQ